MPVHDVDMNEIGAGRRDGGDFLAQTGEIGGENGRSDAHAAHKRDLS